jgi:hypothetical protein
MGALPFAAHHPIRLSSLLKNHELESYLVLAGRCWDGAVELDVIFSAGVGTL